MKIAINTIVDYNNYGNRLQNYALQEVLQKYGYEVETIKNFANPEKTRSERILNSLTDGSALNKLKKRIQKKESQNADAISDRERLERFKCFTTDYINETKVQINEKTTNFSFFETFDAFVIGSDQVWNYEFSRFSFLDFIPYAKLDQKVISYAASFGISTIPKKYENMYVNGLKKLSAISVRESAGADIVKRLIGEEVDIVLDPTMLLDTSEWIKLAKRSDFVLEGNKYLLTYFLGTPKKEYSDYIERYAKFHNLEILRLGDMNDKLCWSAGPLEFLKLFQDAEAIFTDSFHACVFSILFEKYFEVFSRETDNRSMNSRIDTLLSTLNLEDRWFNSSIKDKINYVEIKKKIDSEKKKSICFIESNL